MNKINFIDLEEKKLEGYPEPRETRETLVRYSTIDAYYRYEGQREHTATFNTYSTCSISTNNGSMIFISLPEFSI